MPHVNAAFNYARWLTRNDVDAEDVVQDACVRAMRFLSSLQDGDARPWLFAIVRNTWYSRMARMKGAGASAAPSPAQEPADEAPDPEQRLVQQATAARVRAALDALPEDFREAIVLRDIEGLSYKEIAAVVGAPIGTVMSRIARGRGRLQNALRAEVTR